MTTAFYYLYSRLVCPVPTFLTLRIFAENHFLFLDFFSILKFKYKKMFKDKYTAKLIIKPLFPKTPVKSIVGGNNIQI